MSFFFTNVVQFFVKEKFDYHYNFVEGKIDISSESDQEADFRFAKWLSKNRKLQGIPPTAFFSGPHKSIGENYIRFCFIKVSYITKFGIHLPPNRSFTDNSAAVFF